MHVMSTQKAGIVLAEHLSLSRHPSLHAGTVITSLHRPLSVALRPLSRLCVCRLDPFSSPATPSVDGRRQGGFLGCCGRKQQPTTSPPEGQLSSATFRCAFCAQPEHANCTSDACMMQQGFSQDWAKGAMHGTRIMM